MSLSDGPPIYQLPEELLLQIASHLPDSAAPRPLKNLCLTSRKFHATAQEALYTTVKLFISCGCHPKVNALLRLLRTLFDRPDLATRVRTLRIRTVRKNVAKLCEEHDFDLVALRTRSLAKLEEMGHMASHPWHRTIQNSIESGFAGLLLLILPNLTHLDVWVKDHHRGPPSSECISGLFGGMSAPASIIHGWSTLHHLTTSDTHLFKSGIQYDSLTSLDLKSISIGTILRLNGPGCLQGAENLQDLALTVSIQFADRMLTEKAEVQLGDLFEALGCSRLRSLKMLLINDGYHLEVDLRTQLDAGYFIDQLDYMRDSLETLAITPEITDDEAELSCLLDMLTSPKNSLLHFTQLKHLVIPQFFFYNSEVNDNCQPKDLPPMLETLEILYPEHDIEGWVERLMPIESNAQRGPSAFRKIILRCHDEVGAPASYFSEPVDQIWWGLRTTRGIETYAICQTRESQVDLAELWDTENPESSQSEAELDEDEGVWDGTTDSDTADDDELSDLSYSADEMPDLIDPMD